MIKNDIKEILKERAVGFDYNTDELRKQVIVRIYLDEDDDDSSHRRFLRRKIRDVIKEKLPTYKDDICFRVVDDEDKELFNSPDARS